MSSHRFVPPRDGKRAVQFLRYAQNTFGLLRALGELPDGRQRPILPTQQVVGSLFLGATLRVQSMNELEGHLCRRPLQRALGAAGQEGRKLHSADTISRVLDGLDCGSLEELLEGMVGRAERNKTFRDGAFGNLRCVALDGWEPFSSLHRHCEACLTRQVRVGKEYKTQYYHRFVMAFVLGFHPEVVLGVEPLKSADLRSELPGCNKHHEGELTAGLRLIRKLHEKYGNWLDLFVLDALYANGPSFQTLEECRYGGIITLKKETDEPLREALALALAENTPSQRWWDDERLEEIEVRDIDEITTLDSYPKPVRVLLATVQNPKKDEPSCWCAAAVGPRARALPARTMHGIQRARWHIENTGFHQFTTELHLDRAWRHTPNATLSLFLLWMLAFNLLQLFAFRRLRRSPTPHDPCLTLRSLVLEIFLALACLPAPWPWPRAP